MNRPPAAGAVGRLLALDRLGVVIAVLVLVGVFGLSFVSFKPNRMLSGRGVGLTSALDPALAWLAAGVLVAVAVLALVEKRPWPRLLAAALGLVIIVLAAGAAPPHLIPPGNAIARVGLGAGFWVLAFALAILATDALARLRLGPWRRLAALALALAALGALFGSGWWDGLSVMKEYANNAESFWIEAQRHVVLALGSLIAAVVVGIPLGIACDRHAGLRSVLLPVLNIVQTIPSIAMFGLLMGPLALIAVTWPTLGELGIRGIGVAPAAIALFLYSLLPVVSNTVVGLQSVPRQVVDAARGMGMTSGQRLVSVEMPLALPVLLTGVRIVLVQNIGLATVAGLIGGGGFGAYVFRGLGQAANDLVLLGAAPAVILAFSAAILLDAIIDLTRGAHL